MWSNRKLNHMNKIVATAALFIYTFHLSAQISNIVGQVYDEQEAPLTGAYVLLLENGDQIDGTTTDEEGNFRLRAAENKRYTLQISYLGFETQEKSILTNRYFTHVGLVKLVKANLELTEVQVTEKVIPVQQNQDTLTFNADAFKTLPDADAQELLEKMPTVTVENGKVNAQGEEVKKVLVDGRPFFGNDPTAALRNLPAEVVDKIQIFDQQSDQAQFTGFDDGETTKTVNVITRLKMRNGQFGKVYSGLGTELQSSNSELRYQSGGNINFFNGDQRISIIGMSNNINQQNFATEDLLGVVNSGGGRGRRGGRGGGPRGGNGGPRRGGGGGGDIGQFLVNQQGGITTTHAFGLNYSDKWGKKFEVTGSYFFNQSDNETIQTLNQLFTGNTEFAEVYAEDNTAHADNLNHRANFRLEYKIDNQNSIIMRPSITFQQNNGVETTLGQTILGDNRWNQNTSDFNADLQALNFSNNLLYRHRFDKRRRTLSVNVRSTYNEQAGDSFLKAFYESFAENPETDETDQNALLDAQGWNLSSNIAYTEPIGERSMLMFNYQIGHRWDDSDKQTYDLSSLDGEYNLLNEELSNVFENTYTTHQAGAGFNYRKGATVLMARTSLQLAELANDQVFPQSVSGSQSFTNVLPFVMIRHNFSRMKNIRIMYRTNTQEPTISQLQNVVDNSNPLQLSIGNPDLNQAYQHSMFIRYSATNVQKSTIFFTMLGGGITQNHIANSTFLASTDHPIFEELNIDQNAQLTQPVNVNGYWNMRSFSTLGFPLHALKSNLNINLTGNYVRTPGLVNDNLNYANNTTLGLGLTLSSNISETVDFTVSSRSSQNFVNNTLQTSQDVDYFNQNTTLKFNWIVGAGIIVRTDLTHQYYNGLDETFDQNFLIWSASIGKKLFKKDRGEIAIRAFDILNQNNSITRNVTETYIEDVQTNILQRYVMLQFTYNLRHFVKDKN